MEQERINIIRPKLPNLSKIKSRVEEVLNNGMITNFGKYVQKFEDEAREYLGCPYVTTHSSGTSGLMLLEKVMGLKGEVIVPSFTFSATVNSLIWNGLKPVFVDIDKETFNLNPELVKKAITPDTCAILGVHIFGNPCKIDELQEIADHHNIRLIFDSAHAFGSQYKGKRIGCGRFGDAEVFSLSATKLLTTGEGGLVVTRHKYIHDRLKLARNYGAGADYDCELIGFNSKMQEISAIIGLESIKSMNMDIRRRNELFELYKKELKEVYGISFQKITDDSVSTVKDMAIIVDWGMFGINRNELAEKLDEKGIQTKKYFYPPIHKMKAYKEYNDLKLHNTEYISNSILCLPIYSEMDDKDVIRICDAIKEIKGGLK